MVAWGPGFRADLALEWEAFRAARVRWGLHQSLFFCWSPEGRGGCLHAACMWPAVVTACTLLVCACLYVVP